jgi:hypothetical protein
MMEFFLCVNASRHSGAHPASCLMGTAGSFPAGKAVESEKLSTHLRKLRMRRDIPPLPQYAFIAWCLIKHRDNFNFFIFTARFLSCDAV